MGLVFGVLVVALVLVIAAVVIGREARRLDAVPPNPTFDMDEAVEWVADRLPFEVSAVLSHADVRQIIDWNLEYFRSKNVSGNGHDTTAEAHDIVVGGAETVDYVLLRAEAVGSPYTPAQVHAVLDATMSYLDAINAIGPEAPPPPSS
jgi:hypothetical protein